MVKLIIKNKLYNLTDYLENHPGGKEVITDLENKDATDDFYDIGHSDEAIELLKKYYVKDIGKSFIEKTDEYSKKKYFNNKCFVCFNCFNCFKNTLYKTTNNLIKFLTTQYSERMLFNKKKIKKDK